MAEFDIAALVAEFGAKYENNGQTQKDIKHELMPKDDFTELFSIRPWTDTYYTSVYSTVDEVLQGFSIPFVDKGTISFTPWKQKLGEFKIDKLDTPDKMRHTWLGFLANLKEVDRKKWPYLMWMIRQKLIPGSNRDFLNKAAYWGWQLTGYDGAPTVDGATFVRELAAENGIHPANTGMDGIRTQIAKMVDAGRVTPIVIGAWSADPATFVGQIETFVAAIPEEHREHMDFLNMNKTLAKRFRDGMRVKYNLNWHQESDLNKINDEEIRVRGTVAMAGSDQVWCTPADNRVKPVRADKKSKFDVQKVDRTVKILNNWSLLLTFDVPEFVYTTEHDTTISAGDIVAHYS
ncbi:MAG: hypothetical protein JXR07_20575 [Reichenbachiella sp.]